MVTHLMFSRPALIVSLLVLTAASAHAQQGYEFEVYRPEVSRHFEFNVGIGRGLTRSSDRWVITSAVEYTLGR